MWCSASLATFAPHERQLLAQHPQVAHVGDVNDVFVPRVDLDRLKISETDLALDFLKLIINKDGALHVDMEDDIVAACLINKNNT